MSNQLPDATKLIAENARLRKLAEQNEQAADALWAERDRLRDALEKTITYPWQRGMIGEIEDVRGRLLLINKTARTALQEAGDE